MNSICQSRAFLGPMAWAITFLGALAQPWVRGAEELSSPDGRIRVSIGLRDFEKALNAPVYQVFYDNAEIIGPSRLGLELAEGPLGEGLEVREIHRSAKDASWKPVYGERSSIRDHYRELAIDFQESAAPNRKLTLTARAYDEGVAFRWTIPEQQGLRQIRITGEQTEFRFLEDHRGWAVYSAQGVYQEVPLSAIKSGCERPLVVQVADGVIAAIAEARLVDYARGKLGPMTGVPFGLRTELHAPVTAALPLRTPWRVLMVAESAGRLLENNDIILNLNDPCAIEDTSWIKPGKAIREVTLTTSGGKACVDFAVRQNLQYVEFDAGWYGHEYDDLADARAVNVDPKRSPGPLDLHEIIAYAKERGIGVFLYVNRRALEKQLDEILPLYRQWGVAGVKYGFVQVGSQEWTTWLHEAVRKAAENRLMVDIHDEYRPTGWSRTYPNLLTQEGIAGDETKPANRNTLAILFTRMLAGPADNTICYFDKRVDESASHAYQLAKSVCLYSPLQFLYWYDRPGQSSADQTTPPGPGTISDVPELAFFRALPTVWDDTKVLAGVIGRYAVIARRKGHDWFLGFMNGDEPRTVPVTLDFLDEGQSYMAERFIDDPAVPTPTRVRIDREPVRRGFVMELKAAARGGEAIRIVAQTAQPE